MKSSAAVYARLEIAAKRHDRRPLYDWLMRRTDNAVRDVIAHGLSMAHDPDYRLGVEADRFARREYAEAFDGFMGLGRTGDKYRALIEGALRLRAGIDTDTRRESTRREVERLLGEMRAEIDALRAPAPPPVAPVPVAPEGFGVEYSRDPTMYVPFPGWDSKDDGYKIDGSKVLFWATKKAAQAAARSLGWPLDSVTKVHTRFQVGWALADGRFGLVSRAWLTKNLRPEIISGIFASVGLSR